MVTLNLADFPGAVLSSYKIEPQHPDDFIIRLAESSADLVSLAAKRQRGSLKNPPLTVEAYLAPLERQGLSKTVAVLRNFSDSI